MDYAGRLWVATREGLAVHHRGVWATIGLRDGLPNPNLWPLLMRDSLLYVGMTNAGVAALDLTPLEGPAPPVRFNELVDRGDLLTLVWQAYGGPVRHSNAISRHGTVLTTATGLHGACRARWNSAICRGASIPSPCRRGDRWHRWILPVPR